MSDQAARRRALEELRAKKRDKASPALSATSNGSSSAAPDRATSRHFQTSQSSSRSQPKILVPDSSPSASPVSSVYKPHVGHGVPLVRPGGVQRTGNKADDLLLKSNFMSIGGPKLTSTINSLSATSLPRSSSSKDVKTALENDDRPRKRLNTGSSTPVDPSVIGSSPSPSVRVATPPRRPIPSSSTSVDSSSQVTDAGRMLSGVHIQSTAPSSDGEDLPDADEGLGPSRRRGVIRGRLGDGPVEVIDVASSPEIPRHTRPDALRALKKIAPDVAEEQLAFLLQEEGNDLHKATKRLREQMEALAKQQGARITQQRLESKVAKANGGGRPVLPPSPIVMTKGNKKSAIYAKRGVVDQDRPTASQAASPSAPNQKRKRRGGESDDDSGVDSDGSGGKGKGKGAAFSGGSSDEEDETDMTAEYEEGVKWFDSATADELMELTSCSLVQARNIITMRPFTSHSDLRAKFNRKGAKVSYKTFEGYLSLLAGYRSLDKLLRDCKKLGDNVSSVVGKWAGINDPSTSAGPSKAPSAVPSRAASVASGDGPPSIPTVDDAGIHLTHVVVDEAVVATDPELRDFIFTQPTLIADEVQLKDYQMIGLNWLNLLHRKKMSCILADEMGLGKTIQVIAFFAHLKATRPDSKYRHLVVVPPSTLENWVREFERFAPEVAVQTYYGSQQERAELRIDLLRSKWDVLVTTYNFAHGNEHDRKFFRKNEWQALVFDEGHMLKNYQSQRYQQLSKIKGAWKVLLTGTPLQNNLQELISLLSFLMPKLFTEHEESLRAIFKVKSNNQLSLLSRDRVSRAKQMMTPFILRRRKDQVLKDLPKKTERIEWCEMTSMQRSIYREAMQRSRMTIQALPEETQPAAPVPKPAKTKKSKIGATSGDTSSNVLMDLRKAASHPMLFRRLFDDAKIKVMARHCLMEPDFCESRYDFVVEDMEVMTDSELQNFCKKYKSVRKHALEDDCYLAAGKIQKLLGLLKQYKAEDKRILIFSQFTQILSILEAIFKNEDIKYLILTGSTAVDERQGLVDEFNEDESIPVFLLSTRAGGMGINLTAACVVIIFDQDFNPHNDKQACDRAYRIGQKRDVEIVKLITKGTIEEDIYRIGNTKIMLDDAVAGDGDEGGDETATEKKMKSSLLSTLRKQFEQEQGASPKEDDPVELKPIVEADGDVVMQDVAPVSDKPYDAAEGKNEDKETVDATVPNGQTAIIV